MHIQSMRLIPNEFNGGESDQCLWVNEGKVPYSGAIVLFIREVENQFGPWPETTYQMVDFLECLAEVFKEAQDSPGIHRGEHVEMSGDENFSIEIVVVE